MAAGISGEHPERLWMDSIAMFLISAVMRLWGLTGLGLTQFDEGAYTRAGQWLASAGAAGHPPEPVHAPPLYPLLVGLAFRIFGVQDWVAIGVSALAGAASVLPVFWLARKWFGRRVGVIAGLLWLTTAYSWFYSRMALTDSLFCLLFWSSLYLIDKALEEGTPASLALAGLMVGLAWNTKYHGFFPLVIAGFWLLVEALDSDSRAGHLLRAQSQSGAVLMQGLKRLLPITLLALACTLPWAATLAWTGKLQEVASSLWTHSLGTPDPSRRLSFSALVVYLIEWTSAGLLLAAVTNMLVAMLASFKSQRRLLVVAVFLVLASLAYRSFPRLLLPLVPALCMLTAAGIHGLSKFVPARFSSVWVGVATTSLLLWNLWAVIPYFNLRTDTYRRAATLVAALGRPVLTQCNNNYYFYEKEPSRQLRLLSLEELDRAVDSSPRPVLVFDPILYRFPAKRGWVTRKSPSMNQLYALPISLYPPVLYQGFNIGDETAGITEAPFRYAEPVIEIWEFRE